MPEIRSCGLILSAFISLWLSQSVVTNLRLAPGLRLAHLTLSLVLLCGNLSPAVTHILLHVWVLVIISSVLAFRQAVRVV